MLTGIFHRIPPEAESGCVWNPRRLLDLERMHLLREDALVYSYLEFLPKELFPPLFMDATHGGTHQDLGIMVQACPFCLPASGGILALPHVVP